MTFLCSFSALLTSQQREASGSSTPLTQNTFPLAQSHEAPPVALTNRFDFSDVPDRLKDRPQWVLWHYETRPDSKTGEDKTTKIPYNARTGGKAMSTNKDTWCDFEFARKKLEASHTGNNPFDGIGYVLTPEDGLVGVDLDHVYNPETNTLLEWAQAVVDQLNTYTEITPSGHGLRLFLEGVLPDKGRKKGHYENYSGGRFLTVTGQHFNGTPNDIMPRPAQILQVHTDIFKKDDEPATPRVVRPASSAEPASLGLEISQRLEKAFSSQKGAQISSLYSGDTLHYPSQSEADSALCFHLAYWLDGDPVLIDRAFRASGLMRDKWDESRSSEGKTYGQMTIEEAVTKAVATYGQHLAERQAKKGVLAIPARLRSTAPAGSNQAPMGSEIESADAEVEEEARYEKRGSSVNYLRKDRLTGETVPQRLCNFVPLIAKERHTNYADGKKREYYIEVRCGDEVQGDWIDAVALGSPREMAGILSGLSGRAGVIDAGMEKHLAAAIKTLSPKYCKCAPLIQRFRQTGWQKPSSAEETNAWAFRIRGFLPEEDEVELPTQLPYRVQAKPSALQIEQALEGLEALITAQEEGAMCVATAFAFTAPAARVLDLQNETYACFIAGETGSLKTSCTQTLMCLYGPNFILDRSLIKMGEGSTNVALMRFATHARHLPVLFDNFKPNTGGGTKSFTGLLHNLVEGSDKARGSKDGGLRQTDGVETWPFFTGESLPDDDAAAVARLLPLSLSKRTRGEKSLTKAQSLSHTLHYLGGAWIEWLASEEGTRVAEEVASTFIGRRAKWAAWINDKGRDVPNPLRLASNLAANELVWALMARCRHLTAFCERHQRAYKAGLEAASMTSASFTTEAREVDIFLSTLASLIHTDRALLAERNEVIRVEDRSRVVGYWAEDGGALLSLNMAITAVQQAHPRGKDALNGFSAKGITRQLREGGHLIEDDVIDDNANRTSVADSGQGRATRLRLPHVRPESLGLLNEHSEAFLN